MGGDGAWRGEASEFGEVARRSAGDVGALRGGAREFGETARRSAGDVGAADGDGVRGGESGLVLLRRRAFSCHRGVRSACGSPTGITGLIILICFPGEVMVITGAVFDVGRKLPCFGPRSGEAQPSSFFDRIRRGAAGADAAQEGSPSARGRLRGTFCTRRA